MQNLTDKSSAIDHRSQKDHLLTFIPCDSLSRGLFSVGFFLSLLYISYLMSQATNNDANKCAGEKAKMKKN